MNYGGLHKRHISTIRARRDLIKREYDKLESRVCEFVITNLFCCSTAAKSEEKAKKINGDTNRVKLNDSCWRDSMLRSLNDGKRMIGTVYKYISMICNEMDSVSFEKGSTSSEIRKQLYNSCCDMKDVIMVQSRDVVDMIAKEISLIDSYDDVGQDINVDKRYCYEISGNFNIDNIDSLIDTTKRIYEQISKITKEKEVN